MPLHSRPYRPRPAGTRTVSRSSPRGSVTALVAMVLLLTSTGFKPAQESAGGSDEASSTTVVPRIHNPGLFEKSLRAAAAAVGQYGTTDTRPDREADREDGQRDEELETDLERVQRIGYRLAAASGFDKFPFTFGVVDMPIPNAFALPAGQIFITQGMLDLELTDDQLAALLGHEIAHVTEEHFLKMRRRATLLNSLAQLVTIGAIAASSSSEDDYYRGPGGLLVNDNPHADLAQATFATGAVVSELLLRSYSRDNEDESDEEGQRLAAAAGFDPDGARQLLAKMNLRIPQDKSFGYWQTHPFFDERVLAAEVRAKGLTAQSGPSPAPVESYRRATQELLLDFADGLDGRTRASAEGDAPPPNPTQEFVHTAALRAWPSGPRADSIRLDRLHRLREAELDKLSQSRDYGRLIAAYTRTAEEIQSRTPDSPALSTIRQELGTLRRERDEILPVSQRILEGGIFQTAFLESYLSNFPDSEHAPQASLQLGLSYSRLGHEGDAVEQFLKVWASGDADAAAQASRGLRNLAPVLTRLSALEQLATQQRDPDLADEALARLDQQAGSFDDITNGSEYLRRFPEGLYADTVSARIEELADSLYREMRLYEEVGESAKAIARANQILEHAPLSRAAQRLSKELAEEEIEERG